MKVLFCHILRLFRGMLRSNDKWYGVTYKEDKPGVVAALAALREKGLYPEELWG